MTPVVHEWFTRHVQMTDLVTLGDTVLTMHEWAEALGIPDSVVRSRIANGDMAFQALRPAKASRASVHVRYEHDLDAIEFVEEHPQGATRDEIAEVFGLSRERVRQIEASGLKKLRVALEVEEPEHTARERKAMRLRELIASGVNAEAIAARMGITRNHVHCIRNQMRIAS